MIILYHRNNKVISIKNNRGLEITSSTHTISKQLVELAVKYPDELLVWCNESCSSYLNIKELESLSLIKNGIHSYNTSGKPYLTESIGYITDTPFVNINKGVIYPTWLMSSDVGCIHASVLYTLKTKQRCDSNFNYFLNSLSRLFMPVGLFCYSNPKLLNKFDTIKNEESGMFTLFKFVKQHYKNIWVFLLFLNLVLHEKKFPFLPLLFSFFYKKRLNEIDDFNVLGLEENKVSKDFDLDVVIPTIGRKKYLYDTLLDLSKQTLLPKNIIIVEQNPDEESKSELDYLQNQSWPFLIKHTFINKTGACNARNMALQQIESDWIFMADDDIRFEKNILEIALQEMFAYGLNAATLSCLRNGDKEIKKPMLQWNTFGSGCSIVSKSIAAQIRFDIAFEHGFGEDRDYGMQIRNIGEDIGYFSKRSLLHLKAPIGGFRAKTRQPWESDNIQPKPSPTIMLFNLKNQTKHQILGYKTLLFIKFFKKQENKNIFSYFISMRKRWKRSVYWANKLKNSVS